MICPCEPVLEAEVRHVVKHEMARTVHDVARRTRLGLGACGGMRCAARCGQIVAEERGLPPHEGFELARDFVERQASTRIVGHGSRAGEARGADPRAPAGLDGDRAMSDDGPSIVVVGAGVAGAGAALAAARDRARA